jgi:hypothetical protein
MKATSIFRLPNEKGPSSPRGLSLFRIDAGQLQVPSPSNSFNSSINNFLADSILSIKPKLLYTKLNSALYYKVKGNRNGREFLMTRRLKVISLEEFVYTF